MNWVKVFAPATVANIGPGFDVLGMAVEGLGDTIKARRTNKDVSIIEIISNSKIPKEIDSNTASIAAIEILKVLGNPGGLDLIIEKGLPSGSGLGSSAASAAAGAFAANILYGGKLSANQLISAACNAEEVVSAKHADNTAAAILGGGILVRSVTPLEVEKLGSISDLKLIIGTPRIEVLTKGARTILPKEITLKDTVTAMANTASVATAFLKNDYDILIQSLKDVIVEPHRKKLIPCYDKIKRSVIAAGADGLIISGSGPTICAFSNKEFEKCELIRETMEYEFKRNGIESKTIISKIDQNGTRIL